MTLRKNTYILVFYFTITLLLLTQYSTYSINIYYNYLPAIGISFIFYFYTYKKSPLPYLFLFFIAIIHDASRNYIIGSTAIVYFLTLYLFKLQKKIFWYQNFREVWIGFIIYAIEFNIINNIIYFFISHHIPDIKNLIITNLITIITYPIFHIIYYYLSFLLDKSNATESIR